MEYQPLLQREWWQEKQSPSTFTNPYDRSPIILFFKGCFPLGENLNSQRRYVKKEAAFFLRVVEFLFSLALSNEGMRASGFLATETQQWCKIEGECAVLPYRWILSTTLISPVKAFCKRGHYSTAGYIRMLKHMVCPRRMHLKMGSLLTKSSHRHALFLGHSTLS